MAYTTPEDIANRALQHCGVPPSNRITSISEATKNAKEVVACYDGLRKAELRARPWRFAIRRSVLRALSASSVAWTPPAYAAGTTYGVGVVVSYDNGAGSKYWISKVASNTGNTPSASPQSWDQYFGALYADTWSSTLAYYTGDLVITGGVLYLAIAGSTNQTPPNATYWSAQTGATVAASILYPLKSGPVNEDSTDNAFPLPYGWLANTGQEPRTSVATNLVYSDWRLEGNYIVTRETQAVILRFIADVTDPAQMDAMFAEAFAARIALAICESITQAKDKIEVVSTAYQKFVDEATAANSVETGAITTGDGFNVPEDIANRALQYCGVDRIGSFSETTRPAQETNFCYNKLRSAELRRNVWRFSIRHAVLRPIDTNTLLWTPPAYASGTTYSAGQVVSFNDGTATSYFISKVGSNTGNNPVVSPNYWEGYFGPTSGTLHDATLSYYAGDIVYISGPNFYLSKVNSNSDTPPSSNWVSLGGTTSTPSFPTPFQLDPTSAAIYVFSLPNGWLRNAPQQPKAGSHSALGASTAANYDDWLIEGNFLLTSSSDPILLRFAADVRSVPSMDTMFCEGLAARMAMSVFPTLAPGRIIATPDGKSVQQPPSRGDMAEIATAYKKFMDEARAVNGIETGPVEAPEDDFISVRL